MLHDLFPFMAVLPSTAYSLISLACAVRFFSAAPPKTDIQPGVTVIKPVKGVYVCLRRRGGEKPDGAGQ